MPHDTPPILPLPPQVAAQIKSSSAIPSFASVVLGLIANSLDAEASKVDISVHIGRGTISVEDDGIGIPPREFMEAGGLGRLHHTSKNNSQKPTHGRSGTFLASVAALSILTITSHHFIHLQHASLILHHSRPAARLMPAPSHHQLLNREHGTRVTVQDLFGNMPVRVKHRVLGSENGENEKQLDALKKQIVGLLLGWHKPVSVSLRDIESSKKIRIRAKGVLASLDSDKVEDKALARKFDFQLVCGILSQAGYIEPSNWDDWVKAAARTPIVTIRGAISKQPAPSKQVQFISLGFHSINAETEGNFLYDEVNRLFALSSFGNQEESLKDEGGAQGRRSKDRRFKQDGFTNKQLKGNGKGVDRWPMFYIRVELEGQALDQGEDVTSLREGSLSSILKVLRAMITSFLEENHFRPRARPQRQKARTPRKPLPLGKSPSLSDIHEAKRSLNVASNGNQEHDFSTWSRIKSGTLVTRHAVAPLPSALHGHNISGKQVEMEKLEHSSRTSEASSDTNINPPDTQNCEQTIAWRNPVSGATILINARTGLVLAPPLPRRPSTAPSRSSTFASMSDAGNWANGVYHPDRRLNWSLSSPLLKSKEGSWSSELLDKWENPVFNTTETDIPQVSLHDFPIEASDILHGRRHCCTDLDIQKAFNQSSSTFSAQLSKKALKRAKVVAQVDRKFILIRIDRGPASTEGHDRQLLVLVDQHAADERIRVEALLADLNSSPTPLAKPIIFEIPARENELLTRHTTHFATWGIVFNVTAAAGSPKCRLTVKALPGSIAERCRAEPKVLIEMLRGEAWKREESGSKTIAKQDLETCSSDASKNDKWLARLGTCPQGLLDMLNSRACRSAIMFNDELTVSECQTLVQRLGECAFPFQCAHGRPSMIPLIALDHSKSIGEIENAFGTSRGGSGKRESAFGDAWRRWKPINSGKDGFS